MGGAPPLPDAAVGSITAPMPAEPAAPAAPESSTSLTGSRPPLSLPEQPLAATRPAASPPRTNARARAGRLRFLVDTAAQHSGFRRFRRPSEGAARAA